MPVSFQRFVSNRLISFRQTPHLWGSNESVEMSALMLLEAEVMHYCPEAFDSPQHSHTARGAPTTGPRVVIDAYNDELWKTYQRSHSLFRIVTGAEFPLALFEICQKVRFRLGAYFSIWGAEGKSPYVLTTEEAR